LGHDSCAIQYEPAPFAFLSSVTQLGTLDHFGDFVMAGRIETEGLFLVRTKGDVCDPVVERIVESDVTGPVSLTEVRSSLPGVPRGTVAIAGTARASEHAPDDMFLLTLSPAALKPISGHLMGDHSTQAMVDSRFAAALSVLALRDGFAVTGETTIGPIFDDDQDLYLVKTDAQGETPCNVPWKTEDRRVRLKTSKVAIPSANAQFGSVAHTDFTSEDLDANRDACE
jgi:hypothetical protein